MRVIVNQFFIIVMCSDEMQRSCEKYNAIIVGKINYPIPRRL